MTLSASQWQFAALSLGPGLAVAGMMLLVWLVPDRGIEVSAIQAGIALVLGPTAGVVMHRVCVPSDHRPVTIEQQHERWRTALAEDAARWRRTALVCAATLTIGFAL